MQKRFSKTDYLKQQNRNIIHRFILKVIEIIARFTIIPKLKVFFYRLMGIHIGKNVGIGLDCMLDSSFPELITIEDDCVISHRVTVIAHDDAKGLKKTSSDRNDTTVAAVVLKRGCYIGAGTIILSGVTIGSESVVGAGAVVTKDVPARTIVVGVPARVIRRINDSF